MASLLDEVVEAHGVWNDGTSCTSSVRVSFKAARSGG
jgi:hypothetical protein